jgi:hypothetical protein
MGRTLFTAAEHGFRFPNHFVNDVFLNIRTRGRCGGMAYASLDYYFAGLEIPPCTSQDFPGSSVPPDGHPLADYIFARQIHSFLPPNGPKFLTWTRRKNRNTLFGRRKGLTHLTKSVEFPKLRESIDNGNPVALGLISADAKRLRDVDRNHQVVAYGYKRETNGTIRVFIYDNDFPPRAGQSGEVVLTSDPDDDYFTTSSLDTNRSRGGPWRGFFVQSYFPVPQPPTFEDGADPISIVTLRDKIQEYNSLFNSKSAVLNNRRLSDECLVLNVQAELLHYERNDVVDGPGRRVRRQYGGTPVSRGVQISDDNIGTNYLRVGVNLWNRTPRPLRYRLVYTIQQKGSVTCVL